MRYDILIVGAGVTGLATALRLAKSGFEVAIVDKQSMGLPDGKAHPLRYVAVNQSSEALLKRIEAWPSSEAVSPYREMAIWDAKSAGELNFSSLQLAIPELGYIISEAALKKALFNELLALNSVSLFEHTELSSMEVGTDSVKLLTKTGAFTARLVIGADGADSWVKQQLAINTQSRPYQHLATIATVTTEKTHRKTAYQVFTTVGPLAFLPLQDPHQCSIVFSAEIDYANQLRVMDDEAFASELEKQFHSRLGRIGKLSERVTFPLFERHADNYVSERVALLGDAIHTIHPLAGLGMNLGLKDVAVLTDLLIEKRETFDSYSTLRAYERSRRGHNTYILSLMGLIKKAFANDSPLSSLRGLGMNLLDQNAWLKKKVCEQALMS